MDPDSELQTLRWADFQAAQGVSGSPRAVPGGGGIGLEKTFHRIAAGGKLQKKEVGIPCSGIACSVVGPL